MKKFFIPYLLGFLVFSSPMYNSIFSQNVESKENKMSIKDSVKNAADETVKNLTGNDDVSVITPPPLNPVSLESLTQWWVWLGGVLTPFLLLLLNKIWPSYSKKELILKSTIAGAVIIWAIILSFGGGFNKISLASALVMFIVKVITYDKVLNPLGIASYRKYK